MTVGDLKRILRDHSDDQVVMVDGKSLFSDRLRIRYAVNEDEIRNERDMEAIVSADWSWLKEDK